MWMNAFAGNRAEALTDGIYHWLSFMVYLCVIYVKHTDKGCESGAYRVGCAAGVISCMYIYYVFILMTTHHVRAREGAQVGSRAPGPTRTRSAPDPFSVCFPFNWSYTPRCLAKITKKLLVTPLYMYTWRAFLAGRQRSQPYIYVIITRKIIEWNMLVQLPGTIFY